MRAASVFGAIVCACVSIGAHGSATPSPSPCARGVLATVAGDSATGFADDYGTSAQFGEIGGIALDAARNTMYLSDPNYNTIRAVDLATTRVWSLAGAGGIGIDTGLTDGVGLNARFDTPMGLVRATLLLPAGYGMCAV